MNQVDSRNGYGHDDSNTNTDNGMIIITKCVRNVNKISHKVAGVRREFITRTL